MLCIACFIMLHITCFEDGPKENVPRKKSSGHGGHPPAIPTGAAPLNLPQAPVGQATQNTSGTDSHH